MEQINEAVEKRAGGTRLKKGGGIGGPLLISLGWTAVIAGGAYLGLCAYAVNSGTIWSNTRVLEQDIGGLTRDQAVQKLEAALPDMAIRLLLLDDTTPPDAPENYSTGADSGMGADIPLSDLGAEVDVPALVDFADQTQRSQSFLTAGYRYLSQEEAHTFSKPDAITLDPEKTAETAGRVADSLSWPAENTSYSVEEDALLVRIPKDGQSLDADALQSALEDRSWNSSLTIVLPREVLSPTEVLTAQDIHDAVSGEVKNAGYDLETNAITPEQVGADFDVPAAQAAMGKWLEDADYHGKEGSPPQQLRDARLLPVKEGNGCVTYHRITGRGAGAAWELCDASFQAVSPGSDGRNQFLSGCWLRGKLDRPTGQRLRMVSRNIVTPALLAPYFLERTDFRPLVWENLAVDQEFSSFAPAGQLPQLPNGVLDRLLELTEKTPGSVALGLDDDVLTVMLCHRFVTTGDPIVRDPVTRERLEQQALPELEQVLALAAACQGVEG